MASDVAKRLNAGSLVTVHGSLGHADAILLLARSDVAVALLHDDPLARIGIMSKFFDYVAVGRPILVIGDRQAMLSRIVTDERCGAAREYGDIDGVRDWIIGVAKDPVAARPDSVAVAQRWSAQEMARSYEKLFATLEA
jgi:glycosyltransferase involved in cell wall biosynthesis